MYRQTLAKSPLRCEGFALYMLVIVVENKEK